MDLLERVLDVSPLLGGVVAVLLKDHSVAVEGLAVVVCAPDNNDPFDVMSVAGVLGVLVSNRCHGSVSRCVDVPW